MDKTGHAVDEDGDTVMMIDHQPPAACNYIRSPPEAKAPAPSIQPPAPPQDKTTSLPPGPPPLQRSDGKVFQAWRPPSPLALPPAASSSSSSSSSSSTSFSRQGRGLQLRMTGLSRVHKHNGWRMTIDRESSATINSCLTLTLNDVWFKDHGVNMWGKPYATFVYSLNPNFMKSTTTEMVKSLHQVDQAFYNLLITTLHPEMPAGLSALSMGEFIQRYGVSKSVGNFSKSIYFNTSVNASSQLPPSQGVCTVVIKLNHVWIGVRKDSGEPTVRFDWDFVSTSNLQNPSRHRSFTTSSIQNYSNNGGIQTQRAPQNPYTTSSPPAPGLYVSPTPSEAYHYQGAPATYPYPQAQG